MNATELFRLRLQSLLARGLASSEIAAQVGLVAASEVWGGAEPRDRPAWYVWLRDRPGAFQLELAGAELLGDAVRAGRFTIRHYPSPASPAHASFSPEERRAAGELFDATGTPRIDAPALPESYFTVATLDWAIEREGTAAAFALATLDRLRARGKVGAVVRDVPGWRLAVPLFSAIAALYAQVERCAATRLVVARQAGFELFASEGGADSRDAPDLVQADAVLLFSGEGSSPRAGTALLDALCDPAAELAVDVGFSPGQHPPHVLLNDARLPIAVNHAWFGGAPHAEDLVACAC
jgi:hypothetical protein